MTEGNDTAGSTGPLRTTVPSRDDLADGGAPRHAAPAEGPAADGQATEPAADAGAATQPRPRHAARAPEEPGEKDSFGAGSAEHPQPDSAGKTAVSPAEGESASPAHAAPGAATALAASKHAHGGSYVPRRHSAYASHERESVSDWVKRHLATIRIVLLVCVIALFGSSLILTRCFGLLAGQEVPNVVGYSEESAKALLGKRGFRVEVKEEDTQNADDDGRVLATDPASGENASRSGTVTLMVGVMTQKTEKVPNLVGKTKAGAASAILATNFFVQDDVVYAYSSTVPAGTVLSQAPYAGSERARGSSIDLVVSAGPNGDDGTNANEGGKSTVTIPDVEGMDYDDAVTLLKGMGLRSKRSRDTVDGKLTPGTVAVVAPSVGTTADIGSTVTLSVAAKK
ncbi:MAG: PASTA domain-containing protein [Parafannyhessea sp.]|uniref:PASTA domain-containing protein n=1 Tax=Parafannyhessea sp. TaxID=2847324 RepID=UPI003F09F563